MTHPIGVLRLPDSVHFGRGARASIAVSAASLGRRAFVVVDGALAATPAFTRTLDELAAAGVESTTYGDVVPELPVASVEAAVDAARPAAPDLVIGFGGGSAIDLAKLVALRLRHPGPLSSYYGENAVPGPVLPIVAVPTTAGTGSEVTPIAVVSDPDRALKVGVSDPAIVPRFAIVDPELAVGAPPKVTAFAGIDAMVHAFESLTASARAPRWSERLPVFVGANRLGDLLALEAIAALGGALPRAVADGGDLDAREATAWGSMLAGMAFGSAGTHLAHAVQYPIGAITHTPHGLGTGLMLPYVLQASLPSAIEPLARAADALGVARDGRAESAQAAVDRVEAIAREIGIPAGLAEIGVTRAHLPRIAELALGVGRLIGNAPGPVSRESIDRLLEAAFDGDRMRLRA